MPNKEEYLKRADLMSWSRFLSSPEGKQGLLYLRLSCPRKTDQSDNSLIKNAVGFEFWQNAIDAMISLGDVPARPEKQDDDTLEQA
jgi:hypothetical protein